MKKILLLYVDAGGGHLASCRAIAGALDSRYGDEVITKYVDVSKGISLSPVHNAGESYRWLTSDGLWMWKVFWKTDDLAWIGNAVSRVFKPILRRPLMRLFEEEQPDLVVSVHGLLNHFPLDILRQDMHSEAPFVTVVTDMVTVHPVWLNPKVDCCMVPTDSARERAIYYGLSPDQIAVVGQPVDIKFAGSLTERSAARDKLNLDQDRPCVLIVGGGYGMGPVLETAKAISSTVSNAQMMVVAGKNPPLEQELRNIEWEIPTHVYGFVDNIPDLMSASDVLVTKAGPGTLGEAFIAGLPIIIFSYIYGQEPGNLDYVLENHAGVYHNRPEAIADTIRGWFNGDRRELEGMIQNAAELGRPNSSIDIADRLYKMLQK